MSIAPIATDLVELRHLDGVVFALRVGHNVIHLDVQAVADILALLNLPQYADGRAGQTVHVDREYRDTEDPRHAAVLIAHIGAYDAAGKPAADGVASEPYRKPAKGHTPNPNSLCLALSGNGRTYVATMPRRDAVRLVVAATCGMSDAS